MAKKYVQALTQYLAGSGVIIGAVTITLQSFTDIYGNAITSITPFGDKGYITLEPDTTNEEAATFTTVTVNANGTVTLGGVSSALAQAPYTETSGLVRSHSGGTKVVVTDNVAFWGTFANKSNNEVITGLWTAPIGGTGAQIATATDIANAITGVSGTATNLVYGTVKLSVVAVSVPNPIVVGDNDPRVPTLTQAAALLGTSGTPSSTNKYVTENDTSNAATQTSTTISFTASTKTIADSGSGFVTSGFRPGDSIVVTGSVANNSTFTIVSVSAGAIVVAEVVVDGVAGPSVTLAVPVANKVVRVNSSGLIPTAFLPGGVTQTSTAGENISAGQTVSINPADGKVYKASALDNTSYRANNFIGIAITTATTGNPITVQLKSSVSGLSLGATTTTVAEAVDQSQTNTTTGAGVFALNTSSPVGIPFISGDTVGNLTKVDIRFGVNSGTGGAGNIVVQIYTVSFASNIATLGNLIGSVTVAASSITASAFNTFTFAAPLAITPNTYYIMYITGTDTAGSGQYHQVYTGTVIPSNNSYYVTNDTGGGLSGAGNKYAAFRTYYTTQQNYTLGDNVFLSDTQGTIAFTSGTNRIPIGYITSSSSVVLDKPTGNQLIGSFTMPDTIGGLAVLNIPLSRNTSKILFTANKNGTGGAVWSYTGVILPNVSLINQNMVNGLNTGTSIATLSFSFSSIYVSFASTNAVGSTTTLYFYR